MNSNGRQCIEDMNDYIRDIVNGCSEERLTEIRKSMEVIDQLLIYSHMVISSEDYFILDSKIHEVYTHLNKREVVNE